MAKPQWEIEVVARYEPLDRFDDGLVDRDGLVLHTIELEDAPGYVVPIEFDASCQDDPELAVDVTLEVYVSISAGAVVLNVRLSPRRVKPELPAGKGWPLQRMPAVSHVGLTPPLPIPRLLRDALAHAAMPATAPMIGEMGYHAEALLETLPVRRQPRISNEDRELFRHHYATVLADNSLETELERLSAVWLKLHQANPERWPDVEQLKPLKREADALLERAGGWESFTLQPGSYKLPANWPPIGAS